MSKINRNTVNRYLHGIRERIAGFCEAQSPLTETIEVDESFFGSRQVLLPFPDTDFVNGDVLELPEFRFGKPAKQM